jgi:methionyl-tRNA formyltransferase
MCVIVPFVDHEIGHRLLQKLFANLVDGLYIIPAVVTTSENKDSWWPSVTNMCMEANIPLIEYGFSSEIEGVMLRADWVLLLSWKHLIRDELLCLPKQGILNLHYSLLPLYRGVYPVNWAIINGETSTGFTYHFVDREIDNGAIFMQVEVPVKLCDTARTLQLRIDDYVCDHFDDLIDKLMSDAPQRLLEDASKMTTHRVPDYYSRVRFLRRCHIEPDKTYKAEDLINILRGLTFFPESENAFIIDKKSGKKIFISLCLREED